MQEARAFTLASEDASLHPSLTPSKGTPEKHREEQAYCFCRERHNLKMCRINSRLYCCTSSINTHY